MPPRRIKDEYCENCFKKLELKRYSNGTNGKYNKRFCSKKCCEDKWKLESHPSWKGGIFKDKKGYVWIYKPDYLGNSKLNTGYVKRARLVIEEKIGRLLLKGEEVHHINEIKDDDRIENLLLVTREEHAHIHFSKKRPNRQRYKTFCSLPKEVLIDEVITIGKEYRTYIGIKCLGCNKLKWTRKDSFSKFCNKRCHKIYVNS